MSTGSAPAPKPQAAGGSVAAAAVAMSTVRRTAARIASHHSPSRAARSSEIFVSNTAARRCLVTNLALAKARFEGKPRSVSRGTHLALRQSVAGGDGPRRTTAGRRTATVMKSAAHTTKQPSKKSATAARDTTPVRRAEKGTRRVQAEAPRTVTKETRRVQAEAPPTVSPDGSGNSPMPDLSTFGIEQRDAQAHVGQCESCGRAHRHVVKNPRDAMALESFGRHLASCLAGKQAKSA